MNHPFRGVWGAGAVGRAGVDSHPGSGRQVLPGSRLEGQGSIRPVEGHHHPSLTEIKKAYETIVYILSRNIAFEENVHCL